jgi:hypothetical protein
MIVLRPAELESALKRELEGLSDSGNAAANK